MSYLFCFVKSNNIIETYTVYTGYEELETEFEAFRDNKSNNSLKLLFSIEMLNEGIHIEDIDGVILLRPTISPIIYYQQIGRAIDAGSNKEPLIFDFVNNFDNIGANQLIKDITDARKREIYARKEYEGKKDSDIPEFIVYDEILEVRELFNNIENQIHKIGDWDSWYEKLKKYYELNDNSDVTRYHSEISLYYWIKTQRCNLKLNKLTSDQINKLNLLEFKWDYVQTSWGIRYNLLVNYKNEFGNCRVPRDYIVKDIKLGQWVSDQRVNYKENKLSLDKIDKLNAINFEWMASEQWKTWESKFKLLEEYKNEFLHCRVPDGFIYKEEN
jgi:superfamily II DNA/RNA helicase